MANGDHANGWFTNSVKACIMQPWRWLAHFAAALSCSFTSVEAQEQHPLDTWWWRNPHPAGTTLNAVAYGSETFVAVGGAGSIVTSANGASWTQALSGTGATLFDVAYGNGTFKAFGNIGLTRSTILSSIDGMSWTTNSFLSIRDMAYGNGIFAAVGPGGNIFTSPDASIWTW